MRVGNELNSVVSVSRAQVESKAPRGELSVEDTCASDEDEGDGYW